MTGRIIPPESLTDFTFDTGITVKIRKVSPYLGEDIKRAYPKPRPPRIQTEVNDTPTMEENEADPDYQAALETWGSQIAEISAKFFIKRGVICEIDHEAVAELRAELRAINIELDPDDHYIYISRIAMGTGEDYQDLVRAITTRSQPTEEAIQRSVDTFRPDVSGS